MEKLETGLSRTMGKKCRDGQWLFGSESLINQSIPNPPPPPPSKKKKNKKPNNKKKQKKTSNSNFHFQGKFLDKFDKFGIP